MSPIKHIQTPRFRKVAVQLEDVTNPRATNMRHRAKITNYAYKNKNYMISQQSKTFW